MVPRCPKIKFKQAGSLFKCLWLCQLRVRFHIRDFTSLFSGPAVSFSLSVAVNSHVSFKAPLEQYPSDASPCSLTHQDIHSLLWALKLSLFTSYPGWVGCVQVWLSSGLWVPWRRDICLVPLCSLVPDSLWLTCGAQEMRIELSDRASFKNVRHWK